MFALDGEDYYECPLKIITKQSWEYIKFYTFFEKGFLPNKGGILEQPAKFLDIMSIIEKFIGELNEQSAAKYRSTIAR